MNWHDTCKGYKTPQLCQVNWMGRKRPHIRCYSQVPDIRGFQLVRHTAVFGGICPLLRNIHNIICYGLNARIPRLNLGYHLLSGIVGAICIMCWHTRYVVSLNSFTRYPYSKASHLPVLSGFTLCGELWKSYTLYRVLVCIQYPLRQSIDIRVLYIKINVFFIENYNGKSDLIIQCVQGAFKTYM